MRARTHAWVAALAALVVAGACAPRTPDRERGLGLVNRAGQAVANAQSFSFKTHEQGERVRRSGAKEPVTIDQVIHVRRPDRLHLKATGGRDLEIVYDGTRITLMSHAEKVYGVIPAKGTLSEVIADAHERFDIPFPLGDLIAFNSADKLIAANTQGGWVADETIDGKRASKVAWTHPDMDWTLWVAQDGQPLPLRLEVQYKARKGSPKRTYVFSEWQVETPVADAEFVANVPADYEGIAVVQRAAVAMQGMEAAKGGGKD